jgi:selenocysteine-specific elongation factor
MLAQREPCKAADLRPCETGLEPDVRDSALARLAADGRALLIGDLWMTDSGWSALEQRAQVALSHYHKAFPLRGGMPAGELRERLGVGAEAFAAVCARGEAQGWLQRDGASVKATSHGVRFDTKQRQAADDLMARFRAAPYRPPSTKEAEAAVGPAVLASLIEFGDLVSVAGDVLFDSLTYEQMRASVIHHLADRGSVTVADVRDQFDTSRKYALALLEHLDRLRVTRRVGDAHVLMSPADAGGDR